MQNAFLKDFMKMRQSLHTPATNIPKNAVPTNREPNLTNITLATIIEKKLPQKDVLQYFRKRAEELEAEKESKK